MTRMYVYHACNCKQEQKHRLKLNKKKLPILNKKQVFARFNLNHFGNTDIPVEFEYRMPISLEFRASAPIAFKCKLPQLIGLFGR